MMAVTETRPSETEYAYQLEGTLLEACSCNVLCPCWIGEDPDGGTCDAFVAYHFDHGQIRGIDVGGLSLVSVAQIPGNVLQGNWKIAMFIDDKATDEQLNAIVDAYSGKLGGTLADLAGLIGEVVDVQRAPMVHETRGGKGTLRVGDFVSADMEPYRGPDGETITTLRDSVFSTVPGSPAYVAKCHTHTVKLPQYGMEWEFEGRNAIQADYVMSYKPE
jgi:hypothetical protein